MKKKFSFWCLSAGDTQAQTAQNYTKQSLRKFECLHKRPFYCQFWKHWRYKQLAVVFQFICNRKLCIVLILWEMNYIYFKTRKSFYLLEFFITDRNVLIFPLILCFFFFFIQKNVDFYLKYCIFEALCYL